jgi:hypothetical protein
MAWGTGLSWVNVNRNLINPATGRWGEGPNYEGLSDKTVAVLSFATPAGEPIAVYYNYAVHGVIAGQLDEVSGDIPGGTGLDRNNPDVRRLMNQQRQLLLTLGQMLGEEVLHVLDRGLEQPRTVAAISGAQQTITCAGRQRTDQGREGTPGTYTEGQPVNILLSMLQLGDVYLGGVNAEIFNPIATRFKTEAPYKHSMMVTLTNGTANSGYVPHDAAFGYNTFEVLSSRLQPGCAENSIVNGLLELMDTTSSKQR